MAQPRAERPKASMGRILPRPTEMIAHIDRSLRGHARAMQDVVVVTYNHFTALAARDRDGVEFGKHHELLLGPTGSGKTDIVQTFAARLGVPV